MKGKYSFFYFRSGQGSFSHNALHDYRKTAALLLWSHQGFVYPRVPSAQSLAFMSELLWWLCEFLNRYLAYNIFSVYIQLCGTERIKLMWKFRISETDILRRDLLSRNDCSWVETDKMFYPWERTRLQLLGGNNFIDLFPEQGYVWVQRR